MLCSIAAIAPRCETIFFKLGNLPFFALPEADVLAPSSMLTLPTPGFSDAAASISGPRNDVILAGRLLTSVCSQGGKSAKIFCS